MATRSNRQPLTTERKTGIAAWREHPLIIAATSFGAGLIFSWQFIMPVQTARLEAKLEMAKDSVANAEEISSKVAKLESERNDLKDKYSALVTKNPLAAATPYPRGFDKVSIGSTVTEFRAAYKVNNDFQKQGWLSAQSDLKPFHAIVAYSDKDAPIRSLLYIYQETEITKGAMLQKAAEMFGPATYVDTDNDESCWKFPSGIWVKIGKGTYVVSMRGPDGYSPKATDKSPAKK